MSRERVPSRLKQQVIERAYACCEYCTSLARYSMSPFAVDHITPRSRGGKTVLDNLALVCQGCNGAKYNKVTAFDPKRIDLFFYFILANIHGATILLGIIHVPM